MAVTRTLALAAAAWLAAAPTGRPADPPVPHPLVGTWRVVSAKYGGQEVHRRDGYVTVKHVTPSQFMWASYGPDGKVARAAGGSYTVKGAEYLETPEYGLSADFDVIKGKAQTFTWKIDGNKWFHTGKLSNGLTIEEVWERVERK